jgi:signal transduction histidine kinase
MKLTFVGVVLAAAVLFGMNAPARSDDVVYVAPEDTQLDEGVKLDRGWTYRSGDDPSWADPGLDDSDWEPVTGRLSPPETPDTWQGAGWFRLRIEVPPEMRNRVFSISVTQLGAAEYYLDGRVIRTLGKIDKTGETSVMHLAEVPVITPVFFDGRPLHVFAVRFAFVKKGHYKFPQHEKHRYGGFDMVLSRPDAAAATVAAFVTDFTTHHTLAAAAAITIAVLHLLLFAFYPRQVGHLYYALFTMCAGIIAFLPLRFLTATAPSEFMIWLRLMQLSLVAISITGIRFLYAYFYDRLPRVFWLWLGAGVLVTVVFWNGPMTYVLYFSLLTFVEIFRILILAVIRQRPYAWLIAVGVATFITASAIQILTEIIGGPTDGPELYLMGMLAMLILMSVALALGYAQINKDLAKRLDEVKRLSADRLEQERRAKEQEMQRMRLEADNAMKAKALAEARERQKVLDQLAATNHELRQTQIQLVQSEKMAALGGLVAGVAHEINTPVGAISSMHDTLVRAVGKLKRARERETEDAKLKNTIKVIEEANDVIQSGSERVTTIVKRLRSFARLDEAELKKADIHEGLEDTLTLVHHELKHHVTVHRNYGEVPPINCYPGQLNQVFLNLLVNARQAIEGEGEITITTYRKDGQVHIEIRDTGKGIPEADLNRIFDPGFTTKGVGVGTGLGLSICFRIIQDHRGEIRVDSEVGRGTTFIIILPMDLE